MAEAINSTHRRVIGRVNITKDYKLLSALVV